MSATMDKTQRWIMMVLPVVFIPLIAHFPTGLVLYWMTTNLWTVGQGLVTRRLAPKKDDAPKSGDPKSGETAKRTSRTPAKASDGAQSAPPRPVPQQQPSTPKVVRRKKQKRARR
jgi:YidC/Oxa1 family membrane protein insertase